MAPAHFTAMLEVQRVTQAPDPSYTTRNPASKGEREVAEVARIVVRADTLDALRGKLAAHVALID